jgi:phage gp16-like protein
MARKELAMSEEQYRSMLAERYGVDSAGKLAMAKLVDLVKHFEKLGWMPKRKPAPSKAVDPLCRKIWAQCYSLKRPVPEYADGIAKQMFGIERLTWCNADQLRAITTALTKQQVKEGADTE